MLGAEVGRGCGDECLAQPDVETEQSTACGFIVWKRRLWLGGKSALQASFVCCWCLQVPMVMRVLAVSLFDAFVFG